MLADPPISEYNIIRGPKVEAYRVGTEICIYKEYEVNYGIFCDSRLRIWPFPDTVWKMNGIPFFDSSDYMSNIKTEFYASTGHEIFNPQAINPPPLRITNSNYEVHLNTFPYNVSSLATTLDPTLTPDQLRSLVLDALIGNWTCEMSNVYGTVSATTTIKYCGTFSKLIQKKLACSQQKMLQLFCFNTQVWISLLEVVVKEVLWVDPECS